MLTKCLLLLSFVGTVYCGAGLLFPTSTPIFGCQVDGESYYVGEKIPSSDPCRRCICGDDGRPVCAIVDCIPISKSHCGGFEPLRDPSQCCPFCPKCEINGTKYEPGDFLPLGNPCTHKCKCNRAGRIFCTPVTVRCVPPPRCPSGTKLETLVQVGECCSQFKCVNITCEVEGITYNVGDTIPKEDPCEICQCSESGPVCAIIDCVFPDCPPLTKRVITRIPGVCCPNVSCVNVTTCKVKGVTYLLGDKIPHEDPCVNCHCSESGPVCGSVGCPPLRCPPNHALVEKKVPGECCPNRTCVLVTCEVDGVTYKVGEPILDDNPCKKCICSESGPVCAVIDCVFPDCPPLTKRVITRIPGVCCPNVSCVNVTTCEVKGITYLLGDKIPHEDPCVNCHCSESGPVCGSVGCGLIRCPPNHALVEKKVPGECCPNRTCVPVTCEVDGVTYKGGEPIPDDNPCKKCICSESGPVCAVIDCVFPDCPPLTKRVITRIPGVCCPNVSCVNVTTCEVKGITYLLGDKIPHEDPCVNCHCSESGPVCGSVGCGLIRCPPNHALVEKKVPGECCPNRTCVPVTCEVDGVTYKGGEPILDDNPCKKCICSESGPVCAVIDCVFPDCPPLTKRVITRIPGVCCPNVSCVNVTTCKVKGVTYLLGDKIPHEDPCVNCHCSESGPVCGSVGCGLIRCPPNHALVEEKVPGECCPNRTCVPVTCEVDGVTYKGGEPIPDDNPCKKCICSESGPVCAIIDCVFPDCPPLTKRVITRIPGVCCPNVSCVNVTTCKVKGVTYLLGDKIPHEDPCVNCHCSESGPVCGSVGCGVIRCSLDYALVEEKVPGECCPNRTCVPVTCEVDGVTYKVGEPIPDDDPCTSCHCASIIANSTRGERICASIACVPIVCPPDTKRVITQIPGVCCPNMSCIGINVTTCKVEEITYNVGDKIPHEDPCVNCHCSESGPVCGSVGCGVIRCSLDYALVEEDVPGECCPNRTCVPVTCEANGVTYKVGEILPDDDPCESCRCARISANSTHGRFLCALTACTSKRCPPGTKRVITQIPGACCSNVSCVNVTTCKVNETTYNVGDEIPHEDPCVNCHCSESGPVCGSVGCPTRPCPPFTELAQTPIPGECCPKQECVPKCPPPCTRKLCKSNLRTLCSIPEGGSCLSSACNVTSCKACYYSEGAPRSLPGGCEEYTCATKRNNITTLQKCMLKFGKCIRTRDRRLYGKPASRVKRQRNFKCYAFPCEP